MADYDKAYAIWKGHIGATEPEYTEMNRRICIALLKQIPKKIAKSDNEMLSDYQCPTCGTHWDTDVEYVLREYKEYTYCPVCGQRLADRSDIDEE